MTLHRNPTGYWITSFVYYVRNSDVPVNVLADIDAVVALSELMDGRIKPSSAVKWKPFSTSSTSSSIEEPRTTTSYTNVFSLKGKEKESDKHNSLHIITNSIILTKVRTYQIYGTSRSDFGDSAILAYIHRYWHPFESVSCVEVVRSMLP
jgi:hypothetical protein